MKSVNFEKNVVRIDEFKFSSLSKYMRSLYATLDFVAHESDEKKQVVYRSIIPTFFKRLREYRGISLEKMSHSLNVDTNKLDQFEQNQMDLNDSDGFIRGYLKFCNGEAEFEVFYNRHLREFKNPGIRQSQDAIAKDALKRFGVIMSGVDYKNLDIKKGVILKLERPN